MDQIPQQAKEHTPSSRVLQDVLDRAPADYFTLRWLTVTLHRRSFGILMLMLGILAMAPVGSTVPGLMLVVLVAQMIAGRHEAVFPSFVAGHPFPTRHLLRLGGRAIPMLRYLERVVHPRWPATFDAIKPFVGFMALLLTAMVLLMPVPLSNIAPAMVIALIAITYIEEDGLLLALSFLVAAILIGLTSAAVWGTILGAIFLIHIW